MIKKYPKELYYGGCRFSYKKIQEGKMGYNRDKYLQKKYGISLEQYDKMLENQEYRCGICGKHRRDSKLNFDVDHDHNTGLIRGLLCRYCNSYVMKHLRDNRIVAEGLVKYLDNWLKS